MGRHEKTALLMRLIDAQTTEGSPCGETHIQKAVYFLQEMMDVPLDFKFILYRYGPYSFELRDALTELRADGVVRLEPQRSVGARVVPTERGTRIRDMCHTEVANYATSIDFVARMLGKSGAVRLEGLSTAYFVTARAQAGAGVEERAVELTSRKPHIALEDARDAVAWVDEVKEQAGTIR